MPVGRVYSIRSHLRPDLIYIGSTKETLAHRMGGHRCTYKQYLAGKSNFMTSYELMKLGDAYIELIELVEYTEKSQLHAAESKCIRETVCVNRCIPGRTDAQYRADHREHRLDYAATYRADHKEKIKKQKLEKHTCECGGRYITAHKSRHVKTAHHITWLAEAI
jgi:hypothetical protein